MRAAILATALLCLLCAGAGADTASCYGREHGQTRTATGENYNPSRLTAAYWFAPLGSLIRVLNLDNGRAVDVRVNDRGPAHRLVARGRVIDLSLGACRAIGSNGLARIALRVVEQGQGAAPSHRVRHRRRRRRR